LDWPDPAGMLERLGLPAATASRADEVERVMALVPAVTKLLEEKRAAGVIGSSFDAKINLLTNDSNWYKYVESLTEDLPEIFKVSRVALTKVDELDPAVVSGGAPGLGIVVEKADGAKCERCWNYDPTVGTDAAHATLCRKCLQVVRQQTNA
ncbi:MAG: hypothetical protein PHT59_04065, partial [Candidatus Omnitrophica bacterium]|nr:hypothetical protein [Candidatus Omnitrophota bacterium]